MSLAVSAVIVPSRRLRWLCAGLGACLCAAALAVGVVAPERFAFGGAVAFLPLAAALACFSVFLPLRAGRLAAACAQAGGGFTARLLTHSGARLHPVATRRRIDISGLGQIRLTVQQGMGTGVEAPELAAAGVPVALLPGATVWPGCMVLRLRGADGATWPLVLLPDSVGAGQYRALAVAVRALASGAASAPATQNTLNLLQGANS